MRRRTFLKGAAGAAGVLVLPARTAFTYQANERIRLAVIGHLYVAGQFFSSVHAYPGVELVAVCDPDQREIPKAFKVWNEQAAKGAASERADERKAAEYYRRMLDAPPPVFADFRLMLEKLGGGIDAVVVSMFEHYHGAACGAAMRAGKHVFCERPLGLTVRESRALRELAAETKVATSIRNPGNASNAFRRGVELVRDGAIGKVEEVHVWFDRGGPDHRRPPEGSRPVPEGLHWDVWLGPAKDRPYHPDWMNYAHWREFSNGGIGTFGPHAANLAFVSLNVHELWNKLGSDVGGVIRVRAECPSRNRLSFPKWEVVRWQVPARGDLSPAQFTWHHGAGLSPGSRDKLLGMMRERGASEEEAKKLLGYAGAMLVGEKGVLVTDDHNVKFSLLPKDDFPDVQQENPKQLSPSRGHYHDWFIACRGGQQPWAHFGYANPLSEFLMLGNLATQFDADLEYDPVVAKVTNHAEAHDALGYEYRPGWRL